MATPLAKVAIVLHPEDDVAIARVVLPVGEAPRRGGARLTVRANVPPGTRWPAVPWPRARPCAATAR